MADQSRECGEQWKMGLSVAPLLGCPQGVHQVETTALLTSALAKPSNHNSFAIHASLCYRGGAV